MLCLSPPRSTQPLALILFIILASHVSAQMLFYGIPLVSFHDISALLHPVGGDGDVYLLEGRNGMKTAP